MNISEALLKRSEGSCELCLKTEELHAYVVPPKNSDHLSDQIALCSICLSQINEAQSIDPNHFRSLNEIIWSPLPVVQVMAYRMLKKLSAEVWAQDLLLQIYMDEPTQQWADTDLHQTSIIHKDCNGHVLSNGDSVVLIQDLKVKGTSLTAKRGTAVRRIRLVHDNAEHIEGKVEGQQIVILTKYVKKT